jgi:predicted RecA/RadA family phage recombinase
MTAAGRSGASRRIPPVELSTDERFGGRVRRLAATSVVALGLIFGVAVLTLDAPLTVDAMLLGGWISMPAVLAASLPRPSLRYLLVAPATLVTGGLAAISVAWLPANPLAAVGWVSITVGVALGNLMGAWFWFRTFPVPAALDGPFAPARLRVIRIHVTLIVIGLALTSAGWWH